MWELSGRTGLGNEGRQRLRTIPSFLALAVVWISVPVKKMGKTEVGMAMIKRSRSSVFRFCSNDHN